MSYDIVERLSITKEEETLRILEDGVSASDRKKGTKHRVFEERADITLCSTHKFVQHKLDYIHGNPVSKKWSLATHSYTPIVPRDFTPPEKPSVTP